MIHRQPLRRRLVGVVVVAGLDARVLAGWRVIIILLLARWLSASSEQ